MLSNESLSPPPKKKKLVYLTHLQAPKNAYLNGKNLFRTPQENCLHAHDQDSLSLMSRQTLLED